MDQSSVSALSAGNKKIKTISSNISNKVVPFTPYVTSNFQSFIVKNGDTVNGGGIQSKDELHLSGANHELVTTNDPGDISVYSSGRDVGFLPVRGPNDSIRFVTGASFRVDNQGMYRDLNDNLLLGYKIENNRKSSDLAPISLPRNSLGQATSKLQFLGGNLKSDAQTLRGPGQVITITSDSNSLNRLAGQGSLIVPEQGGFGTLNIGDKIKIKITQPEAEYTCEYGGITSSRQIGPYNNINNNKGICGIDNPTTTFSTYSSGKSVANGHKLIVVVNGTQTSLEFNTSSNSSTDNKFQNLNDLCKKLNAIDGLIADIRGDGANKRLYIGLKDGKGTLNFQNNSDGHFVEELELEDIQDAAEGVMRFNNLDSLKAQLAQKSGIKATLVNGQLDFGAALSNSNIKITGIATGGLNQAKNASINMDLLGENAQQVIIPAHNHGLLNGDYVEINGFTKIAGLEIDNGQYSVQVIDNDHFAVYSKAPYELYKAAVEAKNAAVGADATAAKTAVATWVGGGGAAYSQTTKDLITNTATTAAAAPGATQPSVQTAIQDLLNNKKYPTSYIRGDNPNPFTWQRVDMTKHYDTVTSNNEALVFTQSQNATCVIPNIALSNQVVVNDWVFISGLHNGIAQNKDDIIPDGYYKVSATTPGTDFTITGIPNTFQAHNVNSKDLQIRVEKKTGTDFQLFTTTKDSNRLKINMPLHHNYKTNDTIMFSGLATNNIDGLTVENDKAYVIQTAAPGFIEILSPGTATIGGSFGHTITGANAKINGVSAFFKELGLKYDADTLNTPQKNTYNPEGGTAGPNMAEGKIDLDHMKGSGWKFSYSVIDSLNENHIITFGFLKLDTNRWAMEVFADKDKLITSRDDGQIAAGDVTFDADGKMQALDPDLNTLNFSWKNGSAEQIMNLDFNSFTQIARAFTMGTIVDDGVRAGRAENARVRKDGTIEITYNSGDSDVIGYLPVVYFAAPDELEYEGGVYLPTETSGQPVYATAEEINANIIEKAVIAIKDDQGGFVDIIQAQQYVEQNSIVFKISKETEKFVINQMSG